jgi:hypothetical protein
VKCAFIEGTMRRVLGAARGEFYAWFPGRCRTERDRTVVCSSSSRLVVRRRRDLWEPRVWGDLRESGVRCNKQRIGRIVKEHKIRAFGGY